MMKMSKLLKGMQKMNKSEIKHLVELSQAVGERKIFNRLANGMFPYQPIAIDAKNDLEKAIKARNEYMTQLAGDPRE